MSIEGQLTIELQREQTSISGVSIGSTRPLQTTRIFEGRTPDEALRYLPLIYSVCGTAQISAALGACEQALSLVVPRSMTRAREMLVWMETAREHLLRILLDWPGFLNETVDRKILPRVTGLLPRMTRALYSDGIPFTLDARLAIDWDELEGVIAELHELIATVLGHSGEESHAPLQSFSAFNRWVEQGEMMSARLLREVRDRGWNAVGQCDIAFLPALEEQALHQRLTAVDAANFIAEPCWQGDSYETTPLGRQQRQPLVEELLAAQGNGLMTRLVARLVELSHIPFYLQQWAKELESSVRNTSKRESVHRTGIGLAQIEAARGRLIHRVEIEDGVIRRYQILAPTEWNFHPHGVIARGLRALEATNDEDLLRRAALLINAIDPCVGYKLQVH